MPEETEQYIRIPVSSGHDGHRIRTIEISEEQGIEALYCGECEEVITFLFAKDRGWTMDKAKDWIAEHEKKSLTIKQTFSDGFTVAGYGVIFNGEDLEGERFTSETDFWTDRLTEHPPVLYSHGLDEGIGPVVIGKVTRIVKDKIGLWIEAQIERASEYAEAVRELIKKGLLGWSAGSASHLVQTDADGTIRAWPIVEMSLTPEPCEPRTLGVLEVKALYPDWLEKAPLVELAVKDGKKLIRVHLTA